ncbi:hypothetical protein [Actinomadura sp. WMMB 499]|uniref:hypothetical protein n=1 Tax=Actinomadura sp. WMMB 499 TaxID=1219491 RepID=UPI0012471B8F|nr:hypothetical protein [Actinomadura sp. WMMB 499]QFG26279.1 hypothetical protein F7P10_39200 [Actinomadura sp. WMMB 499]
MFIALSEEEHAVVKAAAEREHLAIAAWAAQTMLAAAAGSPRPEYVELREALGDLMHAAGLAHRIGVNLNQAVAALNSGEPATELHWYAEAAARAVRKLDEVADGVCRRLP